MNNLPHPGSPRAIEYGCTCPVLDNGHGRGYMGMPGLYVMSNDCQPPDDSLRKPDTNASLPQQEKL